MARIIISISFCIFLFAIGRTATVRSEGEEYYKLHTAVHKAQNRLEKFVYETSQREDQNSHDNLKPLQKKFISTLSTFSSVLKNLNTLGNGDRYLIFEELRNDIMSATDSINDCEMKELYDRERATMVLNKIMNINRAAMKKIEERRPMAMPVTLLEGTNHRLAHMLLLRMAFLILCLLAIMIFITICSFLFHGQKT